MAVDLPMPDASRPATALDKSATLRSRLADYHKASPELAHWLARWQADDAKA